MNLYIRVFYFCTGGMGIGFLAATGYVLFDMTSAIATLDDYLDAVLFIAVVSVIGASFCALTTWAGFALAHKLGHVPTNWHSFLIGVVFVSISLALVAGWKIFRVSPAWYLLAAPIFSFFGSLPAKSGEDG